MTYGIVQYYVFNMSSQIWTLLLQRMHEIVANHVEQNNTLFTVVEIIKVSNIQSNEMSVHV